MIKIILHISLLVLIALKTSGQQQNQYTQFTETKLYYNPAFAGIEDNFSAIGRHRNQWAGIDGSPQGQAILLNFPLLYNSLGFGLSFDRNSIGIQQKTGLTGMYSYKLKLSKASVSLGLQFSYRQFINDFTKEGLIAIDGFELDPSIQKAKFNQNIFNIGIGAYLNADRYYLGISIPRSIRADLDSAQDNLLSKEVRHLYAILGFNFAISQEWKIQPNFLVKLAEQSPFDLDIQNSFIYRDQVHLGFNIRAGGSQFSLMESVAMLIGFQFTPSIFASMSYDFNTTDLRQYEEGSFEVLIKYNLKKDNTPANIQNPRYY